MKNKKILTIIAVVITASILTFTACGKDTEPVTSDAVEETESIEEESDTEEIEESEGTETEVIDENNSNGEESTTCGGSSVEISGEAVGNTTLTQEEIDAIKSQMSSDTAWKMDAYKDIMENGSYIEQVGEFEVVWDKVVGTPGDTSWRRMTDAEAQAIIDAGKPKSTYELIKSGASDEEKAKAAEQRAAYEAASAELSNGTWSGVLGETGTIYFDYYQYEEDSTKVNEQWKADHANELEGGMATEEEEEAIRNW